METSPRLPSYNDIGLFIDWHAINILANRVYHNWVEDQWRNEKQTWAGDFLKSVKETEAFLTFWTDYVYIMARRENGGLSMMCRIIQVFFIDNLYRE